MMNVRVEKTLLRVAVLLCGAGLMASMAVAQDTPPSPPAQQQGPPPGGRGGPGRGNPEQRLEMMQKELNLTPDQTTQLKGIFADERTKMEALRSDTTTPQEDKRAKMMAIREDG